ncbi:MULTISPECIES: imidazole glycerol phosphate synthase subunit HisH [Ornithinimicrobium]|uniref:Imidazole glycerol phosphate synthase subunit HisH n=1 Tax=Ornithinimicrobium kibberense TaxID=282060 RepID=A0ABV5V470_9MICO|nr:MULTISPECIES: imidazole glycerol phosphate synthase subunit HisH [Ornithinimicrobium]OLT22585.1 imidazole glycerol phosphate synthase, glutamine amidotransferase subunit [Ornithinimicrobium sp. CNJ-824]
MSTAPRVALVDGGGTNIGSVSYALERLGASTRLTDDPAEILAADRVVLPGVGAAGAGMARLRAAGLEDLLRQVQAPLLGVCLGMQLLFDRSAEDGGTPTLGLVPGEVVPIPPAPGVRVPHMGWNRLDDLVEDPLLTGITPGERAYFVHSYAAPVGPATLASTTHGTTFSAVVRSGLRWGAQFHPERSGRVGALLLRNFLLEVDR